MKKGIAIIFLGLVALAGLSYGLDIIRNDIATASAERESVVSENTSYRDKQIECTGEPSSNNETLNNSGVNDCGSKRAIDYKLTFSTLSKLREHCDSEFGSQTYGCTYPKSHQMYVCMPGSTYYEKRKIGEDAHYIYYRTLSYSCDHVENTIRHELLHTVYADMSEAERESVKKKLEVFWSDYEDELDSYEEDERDEELFVRVGANGEEINDIELIDLYSKVTAAYKDQKQEYYGKLIDETDQRIAEYDETLARENEKQTTFHVGVVVVAVVMMLACLYCLIRIVINERKRILALRRYKTVTVRKGGTRNKSVTTKVVERKEVKKTDAKDSNKNDDEKWGFMFNLGMLAAVISAALYLVYMNLEGIPNGDPMGFVELLEESFYTACIGYLVGLPISLVIIFLLGIDKSSHRKTVSNRK